MNYYILKDREVVETHSVLEWGRFFESRDRILKQDYVGNLFVSTVFLGIDHRWGPGPPLVFETMVLGPDSSDELCWRYSTWDEAMAGHQTALEKTKATMSWWKVKLIPQKFWTIWRRWLRWWGRKRLSYLARRLARSQASKKD